MAISRGARTLVVLLWSVLLGAALAAAPPAAADAGTTWLCRPGQAGDPCGGRSGAPVDCFYVYPTISAQLSTNANFDRSPEVQGIARLQAEPFGANCNVWAPVYRQATLRMSLFAGAPEERAAALELAYDDVQRAWDDYLANHNDGRGVVLIGHSQGTRMLRTLIQERIEGTPVQSQLVSALLLGGNVTVREGDVAGGDFESVPACTDAAQTGCVVAFSAYSRIPPDIRYGTSTTPGLEVLCTNPASLHDNSATAPLHSVIGGRDVDSFHGHCTGGAANVLLIDGPGAQLLPAVPNESWGLHLLDVNVAQGDLVDLVAAQTATYMR
ncbi:MAG: DUF3089 domain-containing protein [Gordonia sp. (in: high G+C Gram-positive bacteria)]|nr:MAG: DUF3089 domain-containing protein [Gordonia sp. (in: high G+C Gram-positive bacteria)]